MSWPSWTHSTTQSHKDLRRSLWDSLYLSLVYPWASTLAMLSTQPGTWDLGSSLPSQAGARESLRKSFLFGSLCSLIVVNQPSILILVLGVGHIMFQNKYKTKNRKFFCGNAPKYSKSRLVLRGIHTYVSVQTLTMSKVFIGKSVHFIHSFLHCQISTSTSYFKSLI